MDVDWGDGSTSEITAHNDPDITHTYSSPGYHLMTMTGSAEAWYFDNSGSKDQLVEVKSFGGMGWKDLYRAFYGCSNLVSFAGGETTSVADMRTMFQNASSLSNLNLTNFNTSLVTSMSSMFFGVSTLAELDLSSFNTSSVVSMSSMFYVASGLISLDLSNFNTSSVIDMNKMFERTLSLTELYLSSFNTSAVTNMSSMFNNASELTSLDLSSFNTSSVTNMNYLFKNTTNLTSLNTMDWDISLPPTSTDIFVGSHASLVVTCDIGTFFSIACTPP